ncbi:MAG: DUF3108 domain-containing protein [Bdellovibrionota bacterium]
MTDNLLDLSSTSKTRVVALVLAIAVFSFGCSSKILKADRSEEILKQDEFDKAVAVQEIPTEEPSARGSGTYVSLPGPESVPGAFPETGKKKKGKEKKLPKPLDQAAIAAVEAVADSNGPRAPSLEDSEGFMGRRPIKDPYRPGEKVTLEVSYFAAVAGDMTLESRNFVTVNGRKSYMFAGTAKSTSIFAMFYAVEDWFETYVDYETLTPSSYSLHVKETKQLRETRTLFDFAASKARYWDKKINEEKKLEEERYEWNLPSYAQNVFTTVFYLRAFTLTPGKKIQFRIAHEKENLVMTTEVLRRERISTPAGTFDTVVLKPSIALDGIFKPVGDIFVWLTDDDRKFIVRLESKIKIGKIVAVAKKIEKGRD